MQLEIRHMTTNDIPFGMELKNIAGWNQLEADWRRFLKLEPNGCFVALRDGERAGTVTTINYGKKFGWVGMVLVHPTKRRRGIGTALLRRGIEYIKNCGVEVVKLDATSLGEKLYDTLGFKKEYKLERREGKGRQLKVKNVKGMTGNDLEEITRFDKKYFGADRRGTLEKLFAEFSDLCYLWCDDKNTMRGYLMARPGYNAYQIGPWVSETPVVAEELFKAALNKLAGKTIFFDIPLIVNKYAAKLVNKYDFEPQRGFTRMYLGENKYPGKPEGIYAISGVEKG